ncbi:CapA family protein, partial [Sphingobacteriales bacterium CHB3]|nr:CapA family protein [Sphingobacteriales bacterium CHB3]
RVIEAGADAIIGHHPHVLQGIELYKGKVIAYSLGNLIFGGNSRHTYDTGLLEIRLTSEGPKYSFIPVHVEEWKASTATGADADSLLKEMKQLSSIFPKSIFH